MAVEMKFSSAISDFDAFNCCNDVEFGCCRSVWWLQADVDHMIRGIRHRICASNRQVLLPSNEV